jgi:hypothetical protein
MVSVTDPYVRILGFLDRGLDDMQKLKFLGVQPVALLSTLPLLTLARRYLKGKFPGRWISRGESVVWPPHSLDLNPLDF